MSTVADRQKPPPGSLFLDHVGHFVPDLAAAAAVLDELGFRLTPESGQTTRSPEGELVPAGTRFRSAMLAEGYIELIQPVGDTPRTQRMRARMGGRAGIHLASFGTPVAQQERERLARHGFEPLGLVHHERAAGGAVARYQVVHVPHEKMPEGRIEYIEHETPAALWQDQWIAAPASNAQCALAFLLVAASDASEAAARWSHFSGVLPGPADALVRMQLARGQVLVGANDEWQALFAAAVAPASIAGYGLAIEAPQAFVERLKHIGCATREAAPGVWAASMPQALGGNWLLGKHANLQAFFCAT